MTYSLDSGAVRRIFNNDTTHKPTVQIIDIKTIQTQNSGERFRLVISDGSEFIQGMLATQLSSLVKTQQIKKFSVVKLDEFVTNAINGKKICVVINCHAIGHNSDKIGNPSHVRNAAQNINTNNNMNRSNPIPPITNTFQNRFNNNNNNNQNNQMVSTSNVIYRPISSLNPYQNGWKIKARCTAKDTMRHYTNQNGSGQVFSIDLLDAEGGEIRATCFNEAAKKFYPIFEKDKCYLISKGSVKVARSKGFTHIKNDYTIYLNADSEVIQVPDDNDIKNVKYQFVNISRINEYDEKDYVDVLGVVTQIGQLRDMVSSKTQKELKLRTVTLTDKTAAIECTLWNDDAENFSEDNVGSILAIKGARVSSFGGRSLNPGQIDFSPSVQEAVNLKIWYQSTNGNISVAKLTQAGGSGKRLSFSEVRELNLGLSQEIDPKTNKTKSDYFSVHATIQSIVYSTDRRPWYLSVNPAEETNPQHQKYKVTPQVNGSYICDKNGKTYQTCLPRYILRFLAADWSGNAWLTAIDEPATTILGGVQAKTALQYLDDGNTQAYQKIFKDSLFKKYIFRCRARSDNWDDTIRVRYDVVSVQLADVVAESVSLIEKLKQLQKN